MHACRGRTLHEIYLEGYFKGEQTLAGWHFVFPEGASAFSAGGDVSIEIDMPFAGANVHVVRSELVFAVDTRPRKTRQCLRVQSETVCIRVVSCDWLQV